MKASMLKVVACGLLVVLAAGVAAVTETGYKLRGLFADGEKVLNSKVYKYLAEAQPMDDPKHVISNPRLLVSDHIVSTSDPGCKITLRVTGEAEVEGTSVSFSPFHNATLSFSKPATVQVSTEQNKFRLGGVLGGVAVMLLAPALVTIPFVHRLGMFLVSTVVYAVYLLVRDSRPSRLIPTAFLGIVSALTLHQLVLKGIHRLALEHNISLYAGLFVVLSIVSYTQLEATGDPTDLQRFVQIALQVVALVVIEMSCHDVATGWVLGLLIFVPSAARTLFNEPGKHEATELAGAEREDQTTTNTTTHIEKHEATTMASPARDGSGAMQFVTLVSDDEADIQEGGNGDDSYGTARVRESHRRRQYVARSSGMQERHESLLSEDEEPEPVTTRPTRRTRSTRSSARRAEQSLPQRPQRARPQRTRSSARAKTASSSPAAAAPSSPARSTRSTRRSTAKAAAAQSPGRRVYTKDELANMSNQDVSAALSERGIKRPVTDSTRPYVEKLLLK